RRTPEQDRVGSESALATGRRSSPLEKLISARDGRPAERPPAPSRTTARRLGSGSASGTPRRRRPPPRARGGRVARSSLSLFGRRGGPRTPGDLLDRRAEVLGLEDLLPV